MELSEKPDFYDYSTYNSRLGTYFAELRRGPAVRLYSITNVWKLEDSIPDAALFSITREDGTYYIWIFSKYYPNEYELLVERLTSGEIVTVKGVPYNKREWVVMPEKC